jgi:uncharacterized sporulation protein YeaH/YhbH (DUF444 family)
LALGNSLDQFQVIPGASVPIKVVTPINQDFRYRQFREVKIPASNAVIFFARDCSGSMDDFKCDIVSDMAWWIDCWIRRYYKKVDRCYFVHDTRATEVDEEKFYTYRYGGGTLCSSVFEAISQQLENRYPPQKYNIYLFYFTDGDNWDGDNQKVTDIIKEKFPQGVVNLVGISQIMPWNYNNSVKHFIDGKIKDGNLDKEHVKTCSVSDSSKDGRGLTWSTSNKLDEGDRNDQIIEAIRKLLSVGGE